MSELFKFYKGICWYNLGLLRIIFYWKTHKYLKKYYNKSKGKLGAQKKTIIYMLDGRAYSGGITDILRGIISMFQFSKEIGFDFKINFSYPYKLSDYLVPQSHNWQIEDDEISYNSNYSAPLWIYSVHNSFGKSREFEVRYQRKLVKRFVKNNNSIIQFHIYTNSDWVQGREYSLLFNELFTPTKRLLDSLNSHKNYLGGKYVSITFRFQQLLGDFANLDGNDDKTMRVIEILKKSDRFKNIEFPEHGEIQLRALLGDFKNKSISVPLSAGNREELINICKKKVVDIRSELFQHYNMLITADSEKFLSHVNQLDFVYAIQNNIENCDNDVDELYKLFLKPYVDMLLISEAERILLLVAGPMYKSGFAKNSSYINNHEYAEIVW